MLTAAHCVVDRSRNARSSKIYTVAVGAHRLSEVSQKIRVSKVIIHPDYDDDTMINDVALLKLERPVNNVQLLTLNNRSSLPKTGTNATVIGWGALWEDGDYPDVLRQVSLPIVSNATANKAQSYMVVISHRKCLLQVIPKAAKIHVRETAEGRLLSKKTTNGCRSVL